MLLPLLTVGTGAQAQFSRYADEIDLKGLDVHPRPSLLREVGTQVYGAIDLGVATSAPTPPPGRCFPDAPPPTRVANITPSLFGLRAREMLQDGWFATANLEHGLGAASGAPANDCGVFFDRAATVGLAHRRWGRLELGRQEHPAHSVALHGDPWSGNGPASPTDFKYYARPVSRDGTELGGSAYRVRAPQALTYTSPEQQAWWLQAQYSLARRTNGNPDPETADDEREYGMALHWQTGKLHAAAAYQRWNRETWALPLSLVWTAHLLTGHLGYTRGQLANGPYSHWMFGASISDGGGAHPGETRVGLSLYRDPKDRTCAKFGLGRVWPLSRRTQIEADAGVDWHRAGPGSARAGVALQHRFAL